MQCKPLSWLALVAVFAMLTLGSPTRTLAQGYPDFSISSNGSLSLVSSGNQDYVFKDTSYFANGTPQLSIQLHSPLTFNQVQIIPSANGWVLNGTAAPGIPTIDGLSYLNASFVDNENTDGDFQLRFTNSAGKQEIIAVVWSIYASPGA